jgi:Nuclease-related domain
MSDMWPIVVWFLLMGWLVWFSPWKQPTREQRAEARGAQGELAVAAELRALLTEMCGSNFVLRNSVILNIAPGTRYPTAEIDHLVITSFGIFAIETKAWSGQIMPGQSNDSLIRLSPAGVPDVRKSPLAQNRSKVAFIRGLFPGELLTVAGVGVFSSPDARLSPDLPADLIGIRDLRRWLREQLVSWRGRTMNLAASKFIDIASMDREIMKCVDMSPGAATRHKERIAY